MTPSPPPAARHRGRLFVITAPSGAGKTTLRNYLLRAHPDLYFSVSATTRPQRPGEIIYKDYHFMTRAEFAERLGRNEFLEHAVVFGNSYGTLRSPVEEQLASGRDVLLDIDTNGARQVKERMPEAVLVFIMPPSTTELERRLRARGTETGEALRRRLREAEREMAQRSFFDHVVVNDKLEQAQQALDAIMYPSA